MNREIKFRALTETLAENEWLYISIGEMWGDDPEHTVIDESTISQFTGLKDNKTGKEIYEGDIVRYNKKADGFEPDYSNKPVVIIWNEKKACFDFKDSFNGLIYGQYEVIGNIWESPSLLENENEELLK